MIQPGDRKRILDFALGYPFTRPDRSFVYADGTVRLLGDDATIVEHAISDGRVPVLAYGSNASPLQLNRKFSRHFPGVEIPVMMAEMQGWDVVYAALFAPYGSVPATLIRSTGARVEVFVTYLTEDELKIMHKTEGAGSSYSYGKLHGTAIELGCGLWLNEINTYMALSGALSIDGEAVALREVSAAERILRAVCQREMLEYCRNVICPYGDFSEFLLALVSDPTYRDLSSGFLAQTATTFDDAVFERLI